MNESCGICGGDGLIQNSFGGSAKTCPGCHGSGRRSEDTGFRDVTKTKGPYTQPAAPSSGSKAEPAKPTAPRTADGSKLAVEIRDSTALSSETKIKLIREIIEHESSHGLLTKTF